MVISFYNHYFFILLTVELFAKYNILRKKCIMSAQNEYLSQNFFMNSPLCKLMFLFTSLQLWIILRKIGYILFFGRNTLKITGFQACLSVFPSPG